MEYSIVVDFLKKNKNLKKKKQKQIVFWWEKAAADLEVRRAHRQAPAQASGSWWGARGLWNSWNLLL